MLKVHGKYGKVNGYSTGHSAASSIYGATLLDGDHGADPQNRMIPPMSEAVFKYQGECDKCVGSLCKICEATAQSCHGEGAASGFEK
jgi:hypothetical protein